MSRWWPWPQVTSRSPRPPARPSSASCPRRPGPATRRPTEPRPSGHVAGLLDRSKQKASAMRTRAEELFERHRDRPLVDLGMRLYERDRGSAGTVVSSAVAFRLFLFFVPLLLFLVGLLGFLAGHLDRSDVRNAGVTGGVATQISSALDQPNATRWIAVGVGLIGIVTTGRTLTKTLAAASCLAWRLPVRPKASMRATGAIVGLICRRRPRLPAGQPHPRRARHRRRRRLVRRGPRGLWRGLAPHAAHPAEGHQRPIGLPARRVGARADVGRHAGDQPALPARPLRAGLRSCTAPSAPRSWCSAGSSSSGGRSCSR